MGIMPPRETSASSISHENKNDHHENDAAVCADAAVISHSSSSTTTTKKPRDLQSLLPKGAANETVSSLALPFLPKYTFHWELNLYTAMALAVIYYGILPVLWRGYFRGVMALVACDAATYYYCKGTTAGVPYTLPFVSLLAMIVHPVRFWAEQAAMAMESKEGISTNTLVGKFMLFVTDPTACRQVFTGEGVYGMYAHPNALWLFGPQNLIYVTHEPHKRFRAILTPALFSQEALLQYADKQEAVCQRFLRRYAQTQEPFCARTVFRTMAAASSQEAFLGPYLTDEIRHHLEHDIVTFTMGFLSLPFPYLNSGLHQAIQAKNRIEHTVASMVPAAREYVQQIDPTTGKHREPRCLLERWSLAILEEAQRLNLSDPQQVPGCNDQDIGRTVLDFLFAAQDATNSALTYALDVLDAHRDVLQKMREVVDAKAILRSDGTFDWAAIRSSNDLEYINKVANQLLHHKPPVPMVPHLTKVPTMLNGVSIPAGTIVIPSITYSTRVNGTSVDFLPERDDPDTQFLQCLTFGAGQHKCPGRRYAEHLLQVFLTVAAAEYDWRRTAATRPGWDDFIYFPTLFPVDSEFVLFSRQK